MSNPYFGRKWELLVILENGEAAFRIANDNIESESLRMMFSIQKVGYQAIYYGDITIYNLKGDTEEAIIEEGARVVLSAGYQNGAYGKIFDGRIFQPIRDRENVVDYSLTLHCIDGDSILGSNFVKFTLNAGADQRTSMLNVASRAQKPIPVGSITQSIDQKTLPRGKTFFGDPRDYFRETTQDNNAQFFVADGQLNVSKITDETTEEILTVSPQTGLIGTPQQVDYGAAFTCLLNPNIKISVPAMKIKLDMSIVRQNKITVGQLPTLLDRDGIYQVSAIHHIGDTRGTPWYTMVTGISSPGKIPLMLETVNQTPN